jgi:hypothetical protein
MLLTLLRPTGAPPPPVYVPSRWARLSKRTATTTTRRVGDVVTVGGTIAAGILHMPAEQYLDGLVVMSDYLLEYDPAVFTIRRGTIVTVDGIIYRAKSDGAAMARPYADGVVWTAPLEPTT